MAFSEREERIIREKLFGDGVATTADLVAIRGATPSATELGYIDGVTPGTVEANKAIVPTTSKHIDTLVISKDGLCIGSGAGTAVTCTAAQLNKLTAAAHAHIADLAATVVKTDIDDAGTIDGTEVAAALQAVHLAINAIIATLETFGLAATS
jgi:hypothetical protein